MKRKIRIWKRGAVSLALALLMLSSVCLNRAEAAGSGTVTWSVEVFTVGCGYLVEPVEMPLRQGENAARQLLYVLHAHGLVGYYDGTPDSNFYLAYIGSGSQTAGSYSGYTSSRSLLGAPSYAGSMPSSLHIPSRLDSCLRSAMSSGDGINNYDPTYFQAGYLGEFDVTNGSGWMYSVNNTFPGTGFAGMTLSDGDVVRVQFTLAYGNDIGGGQGVGSGYGSPYYAVANKDRLTRTMAQAAEYRSDSGVASAYAAAKSAASAPDASQSTVDAACSALERALEAAKTPAAPEPQEPTPPASSGSSSQNSPKPSGGTGTTQESTTTQQEAQEDPQEQQATEEDQEKTPTDDGSEQQKEQKEVTQTGKGSIWLPVLCAVVTGVAAVIAYLLVRRRQRRK